MAKPAPPASLRDAPDPVPIIAGIGCRRGASADEIMALLEAALAAAGSSAQSLLAIATLDRKADEPGLLEAAAAFGVPLRSFAAEALASGDTPSKIRTLVGVPSVAEAVAKKAGPLLLPKQKSASVTCALAACAPDFDLETFGQAVAGGASASTASIAASRSLTSNAGP